MAHLMQLYWDGNQIKDRSEPSMPPIKSPQPLHWLTKSCYLLLIAGFVILGFIGLVLPIIAGLVFLFLAVLLLTRISTRVHAFAGSSSGFRHLHRRWHAMNLLQVTDRVKLGLWYCAGATIRGIESGLSFVQNWLRSRSSPR